jgi:hypothetical protein
MLRLIEGGKAVSEQSAAVGRGLDTDSQPSRQLAQEFVEDRLPQPNCFGKVDDIMTIARHWG